MENNHEISPVSNSCQDKDTKNSLINPHFDTGFLTPEKVMDHADQLLEDPALIRHREILQKLLKQITPIDYEALAFPNEGNTERPDRPRLKESHYLVLTIENVFAVASNNKWALCKKHESIYVYNGAFWSRVDKEEFQNILGEAAEIMGVPKFIAKHFLFREKLYKQFLSAGYLEISEPNCNSVFINLKNGTFEITGDSTRLRNYDPKDFLTYQLPFDFNPAAQAPIFQKYMDRVQPDKQQQMILAEYLGYVFIKNGNDTLKLEKTLILYGSGANGKSVFFEIVNALLGKENISSYSLQSITSDKNYCRASLANKLVNYASEINVKMDTSVFKAMVSREPVEARVIYGQPFLLDQYAKFIFNCNELPREVEHTYAFYRRFLIIKFVVTIPEEEQDKQLHSKIIQSELSGVFNWVLEGLRRLLIQKDFTKSEAVNQALEEYKLQSDTVNLFFTNQGFQKSPTNYLPIKGLYMEYRGFCQEDGFIPVSKSNFIKRLEGLGIVIETKNVGKVAFIF